jgi:glycosyltransferase involved in cell wall biosynthesis
MNASHITPFRLAPSAQCALGAVRPQKNFMTAAASAIAIQKMLGVPVDFHMSTGGEGDGGDVARAIRQMCLGIPNFRLHKHHWQPWEEFIETLKTMDLLLQPSYTESFNMITADGILVGVPSVVSRAIAWAPEDWKADSDDALDIARTGVRLLQDSQAIERGLHAIRRQNEYGIKHWKRYIFGEPSFYEKVKDFLL